jgi:hypothetical protein
LELSLAHGEGAETAEDDGDNRSILDGSAFEIA